MYNFLSCWPRFFFAAVTQLCAPQFHPGRPVQMPAVTIRAHFFLAQSLEEEAGWPWQSTRPHQLQTINYRQMTHCTAALTSQAARQGEGRWHYFSHLGVTPTLMSLNTISVTWGCHSQLWCHSPIWHHSPFCCCNMFYVIIPIYIHHPN